ncbi:MAG TPA: glycosyltransferase [Candidatus Limnocylindria bacterium]|nr:glycosyltransferase [Candidatus Limnocylindria bacterium]
MRVAIATTGTIGDVRPFAALASALVAHGHEVTAVSWELYRGELEASGARFVAAGPPTTDHDISETAARAADLQSPLRQVTILRDFHLRDAAAHYRALCHALAGHDLALVHGVHSLAQAAALDAGVPLATAVFDPVLLPTASAPPAGMPNLGTLNHLAWRILDGVLARLNGPLHAALAEAGSKQRPQLFRGRSALLHLIACSPAIMRVPPDLPAATHVTGYWPPATEPAALPAAVQQFLDSGAAPVVVTFGSMAGIDTAPLIERCAAAARNNNVRVVLQDVMNASGASDAATDGQLLRIGSLDHRRLFPRAAAVVHHGGAGTTHAVVAAGVPSLVIPHIGDQRYWAERLRLLGIAPRPIMASEADERRLTQRLAAALSPEMAKTARSLAGRLRAERGVEASVRLLEETAASA